VIGIITDGCRLARWQANALSHLHRDNEFLVLNCTNAKVSRNPLKHALYYLLNLLSLKTARTRSVPIPSSLRVTKTIDFEAAHEGGWQSLPPDIVDQISAENISVLIKFGMGLLRVPSELPCPILSYHHGDPRKYRGRPAGFYEMLAGEHSLGQIVQILSNKLDSGKVVGFAETKIHPYSYRATMDEAYRCSALLLPKALSNALAGKALPIHPDGPNYRLPSNAVVLPFLAKMVTASLCRFAYGAFFEKHWQVAKASGGELEPGGLVDNFPSPASWEHVGCPGKYRFIADPFPNPVGDGIFAEGLRRSDSQGEILCLGTGEPLTLCSGRGHFSYPATVCQGEDCFLVPEISEWSLPRIFRLCAKSAQEIGRLQVDGAPRLIDPTLFQAADGTVYLFGNEVTAGHGVLRLWFADDLLGEFAEHPGSPICISPAGARMGGALMQSNGRLFRWGQDGRRGYGNGLILFEILELAKEAYSERESGHLRFSSVKGPHTLNISSRKLLFDLYRDRFSPFGGLRRLRSRLTKRSRDREV